MVIIKLGSKSSQFSIYIYKIKYNNYYMEEEKITFESLPASLKRNIILEAMEQDEDLFRMVNLRDDLSNLRMRQGANIREAFNYDDVVEETEPKSVINLDLETNAHERLRRGSMNFRDYHYNRVVELQNQIEGVKAQIDAAKPKLIFYNVLLNRMRDEF